MKIVQHPAPILEKVANPIEDINEYEADLNEMKAYVEEPKNNAAGLAMPQIGISKRAFVAFIEGKVEIFINPRILKKSKGMISLTNGEGCLSIPDVKGVVPRHKKIDVVYTDINGERVSKTLVDVDAIVFQHEFDHLDGILFLSKMKSEAQTA